MRVEGRSKTSAMLRPGRASRPMPAERPALSSAARSSSAFSEQVQLFTIDGHVWPHEPYMLGADQVSTMEFGGSEVINAYLTGGAGGPNKIVGEYMWKNQRPAFANAGQWGLFKVLPIDDQRILPLMPQVPPTKTAESENGNGAVSRTSTGGR